LIRTPSKVLSAILNSKAQDARLAGITFNTDLQIPLWTMSDFDAVVILGNLLDNAIRAAQKCNSPYINLCMKQVDSYLDIDCTNNHCETILEKNGKLLTTREQQKELHGLGLSSVRRAVNRINGELEINYTDDTFHAFVSFPNYL
jgi:sensor histidine kinase regulating citrate/malate metabolism